MRSLNYLRKYIRRVWRDGDIDYFRVVTPDKFTSNEQYLTDMDYIRFSEITNEYIRIGNYQRTVFINDFRFEDEVISRLEYNLIKEKATEGIII